MSVETATYISQLNPSYPAAGDPKSEGDDHMRLTKQVLQNQFPNLGANAVTATAASLSNAANKAGDTYTGTHDFSGATSVKVPTPSASQDAVNKATLEAATTGGGFATQWVSGTTYAIGNTVYSPTNLQNYRRKTNGAGTTDPSLDATNWTSTSGSGIGTVSATVTTNTTLTASSEGYQFVQMASLGKAITLPDATTLTVGGPRYIIDNTKGGYPLGIRDNAGTLVMAVAAGGEAFVMLKDNSTAAGAWSVTGSNLEPGLITIDNTFSSTYASTVLAPFVALDNNTSIHFAALASGFAAFVVDNAGKVVGTPVTVDATTSSTPKTVFKVSSTSAIVFFGQNGNNSKCAVLSLAGSSPSYSVSVGSIVNIVGGGAFPGGLSTNWSSEDFLSAPKIAQLSSTLYLFSATSGTNTAVAAISVSGTTITVSSSPANIITTGSQVDSTTTYALTATTALVLYKSGAAAPYSENAVVISVSGTTCTVGTPAAASTTNDETSAPCASCQLSATKVLVTFAATTTVYPTAHCVTITGTSVSWGAALTVESVALSNKADITYTAASATRYNPHLFPLSASTALLWYAPSGTGVSRVVVLSESGGTITKGGILYRSISSAGNTTTDGGAILPQGLSEICSLRYISASGTAGKSAIETSKINGTSITVGASAVPNSIGHGYPYQQSSTKLSSGVYVIHGHNPHTAGGANELTIFSSNGDSIKIIGSVKVPVVAGFTAIGLLAAVSSNRIALIGGTVDGTTIGTSTYQLRLLNVEIAA